MQDPKQNSEISSKSRSQIKSEAHDITTFGKKLIELNENQIKSLPLDEKIIDNLLNAKNMSKIALKRQLQYIGKLLRSINIDPIYEAYNTYNSKSDQNKALIQRIENLRSKLIDPETSKDSLTNFLSTYPNANAQVLRQLIRNTQKDILKKTSQKNFKELFQLIKNIMVDQSEHTQHLNENS
jgi:ribosome-associated protein